MVLSGRFQWPPSPTLRNPVAIEGDPRLRRLSCWPRRVEQAEPTARKITLQRLLGQPVTLYRLFGGGVNKQTPADGLALRPAFDRRPKFLAGCGRGPR